MEDVTIVHLDEDPVRFTPDGKVSVIDAIGALSNSHQAYAIWKDLKSENPDVLDKCEEYAFEEGARLPVAGTEGWERILQLLPSYLLEVDLS